MGEHEFWYGKSAKFERIIPRNITNSMVLFEEPIQSS